MQHLRLTLLGIALLLPFGCGGDDDDKTPKTPEKTPDNAAENSQNNKTPKQTANQTLTKNTPTKNTPVNNLAGRGNSAFGMVPQNAALLVSVSPSAIFESPFVKSFPIEEEAEFQKEMAEMKAEVGFDVRGISSMTLAAWPGEGHLNELPQLLGVLRRGGGAPEIEQFPEPVPDFNDCNVQPPEEFQPGGPGGPGGGMAGQIMQQLQESLPKFDGAIYMKFQQPIDMAQLRKNMEPLAKMQQQDFQGKPIWVHPDIQTAGGATLYQPDSQSLVVTFKDDLAEVLNSSGTGTLLSQASTQGADADFTFMLDLKPFDKLLAEAPKQMPGPGQLVSQLTGISLFVDANSGIDVNAYVNTKSEQAAQQIHGLATSEMVKQQLESQVNQSSGGLSEDLQAEATKLGQSITDSIKAEVEGTQFHFSLRVPETAPAVLKKIGEEQKKSMQGKNNLKQIGLACHNYHETFDQFPFPNGPADKKSQLSWRVHLLPYLDQQPLYEQFKLDEPWDSEHNKALLDKMPDIFKLSDQTKPGHTQFVAPSGEGFIIDGDKTRRVQDFTDGTVSSLLVLSVKPEQAVPWTKPGGVSIDPAKAAEVLSNQNGNFLALFADGSVQNLPAQIDAETLKGLLTISGGEVVEFP